MGINDINTTIIQCLPSISVSLNASRTGGISNTINARPVEARMAPINGLFFNGLIAIEDRVFECRFLTCMSCANMSVANAIV